MVTAKRVNIRFLADAIIFIPRAIVYILERTPRYCSQLKDGIRPSYVPYSRSRFVSHFGVNKRSIHHSHYSPDKFRSLWSSLRLVGFWTIVGIERDENISFTQHSSSTSISSQWTESPTSFGAENGRVQQLSFSSTSIVCCYWPLCRSRRLSRRKWV